MRKKSVWLLCSLGLVLALQGAAQTAPTEAQPQVQVPLTLTKPPAPACAPPCLTAEQEAALVEVRKILKEARQVAEGIETSGGLFSTESERKSLRKNKAMLLENIERAQFRAGDFSTATTTEQPWSLALEQMRYGNVREAVKAASRHHLSDDTLFVLVDSLTRAGAIQEAITVAETNVAKQGVPDWRQREQATVLSLIARRQHEAGDPAARATLQRAVQTAQAMKYFPDKYPALIHVARAQAVMGDRTASAETFRQAIQTLLAIEGGKKAGGLWQVAKVQAEVGDLAASEQTFQQAIQLSLHHNSLANVSHFGCIAWAQAVSGQRAASAQTFQLMLNGAVSLPLEKRVAMLVQLGMWQRKALGGETVPETINRALESAKAIQNAKTREESLTSVAAFATRTRYFQKAMEIAEVFGQPESKIGQRQLLARILIETKDPSGTPAVFSKLAQEAIELSKRSVTQDKSLSLRMLEDLVLLQAAAGDLSASQRTVDTISDSYFLGSYVYPKMIQLLTKQGNLAGGRQVAESLKEEWMTNRDIEQAMRDLAKAYASAADVSGALAWAKQQKVAFAQAYALLGVAEGLMERKGIEDSGKWAPEPRTRARETCPVELMS